MSNLCERMQTASDLIFHFSRVIYFDIHKRVTEQSTSPCEFRILVKEYDLHGSNSLNNVIG